MTRLFSLLLAFVAVSGLLVSQADARGGGHGGGGHHGGGHHGGGHHGGGHHGGAHHGNHHAGHHNHAHHMHYATHNHHPFTPDWYAHHPNGWGYRHHYANGWGWTNYGTAAGWLGLAGAAALDGTAYNNTFPAENTTVYTSDTTDDSDNGTANDDNNESEPLTIYPQAEVEARRAAANELAQDGIADPEADAKFLSLGVFSLAPQKQKEATAMVQLSVSQDGTLRGTYYDLLSDEDEVLRGSVDKKNQRVAWTVGKNSKTVFETELKSLTQATGPIAVHYPNGQTRQWTLARFEEDPTKPEASTDESADSDEAEGANTDND